MEIKLYETIDPEKSLVITNEDFDCGEFVELYIREIDKETGREAISEIIEIPIIDLYSAVLAFLEQGKEERKRDKDLEESEDA